MVNLSTRYLGIELKNPIVVSSSGLSNSVDKIKKIEAAGAGAVVLKSLFEEQINYEASSIISQSEDYPEAEDYIRSYTKSNSVDSYLTLIEEAKKEVTIPIIASINCISADDWTDFAKKIEIAGADALELNIHIVTSDHEKSTEEVENIYLSIIEKIKTLINIPIAVKIGPHFSNLTNMVDRLYHRKANGVVLFNRFFQPDIDVDNLSFTSSAVLSSENDIRNTLRWVGIISDKVNKIDISASTGVHDGRAVAKLLLAGASTVQVCSVLYKKGVNEIEKILVDLTKWMEDKDFKDLNDVRGLMSYGKINNPAVYERAQFMKYFSSLE
jgi:dihydroorotate dehydrogenase (fumarate)